MAKLPARQFRKYKCVGHLTHSAAEKKHDVTEAEETPWKDGPVAAEISTATA